MKKSILLIGFAVLYITSGTAQDNCSKYYPLEKGATFEYTMYNKKGKTDGTTEYKIAEVDNSGGKTTATMEIKYTDDKGKEVLSSEFKMTCTGEGIKIDYASLMPSQMMEQYKNMNVEMDMTGTDVELPNDLNVGQTLSDANVTMNMSMSGIKMNITVDMVGRKVEKKESITTSAGTFDCYLITETNRSKTMGAQQETHSKLWLSEGVGMVKQEMYKKNGDLMSRTELTKYSR